jgi:hypothetical protein
MKHGCREKDGGSHHCTYIKVFTVVTEENVADIEGGKNLRIGAEENIWA